MSGYPLRRLVSAAALVVAVVSAVAVPAGYFAVNYSNRSEILAFKGRLNAVRVSQYIYTHDNMWQYQDLHLKALIQLPEIGENAVRQKIYDITGRLVLESGDTLPTPVQAERVPIVVGKTTVGYFVTEGSLRDTLHETAIIALLSSLLGFGIYFAVRWFPLRVLDRTLGALNDTQSRLAAQNDRFDTALTNMSQGLCMFDADGKLVIFNSRFAEIYGLPMDDIAPGMTTEQLIARSLASGKATVINPDETLALRERVFRERSAGSFSQQLTDGRSISISFRPMPAGGFVVTFEDITERLASEARIKHLAHFDSLTDLPNRVTFYERMGAVLDHRRRSEKVAILSIDLDHFKDVNDTLGHPVGDRLLQMAAARMRACIREEDIVARLGGDEFAVVQVPSEQASDVSALAGRMIEAISAPYDLEGQQVVIGSSVGIAIAPGDGDKPDVLMKNADLALYRAKADRGNVYRFFEAGMDANMLARRGLEAELRKAIVNGEFELYYQPIIDVKSGQISCCEALVRWHHPERGLVPPLDFIPLAEETGLIVPLGEWILRQACAEAIHWPNDVTLAVNVSPAQFKSRNFLPTIINALAATGMKASRLELEITELVLLDESEGAFGVLHQLRGLGIRIAMDDFGTGYSSLGYLRSFPFDKIKIDQSFIRDLPTKEDSVAIVRAVVGLSSSLGITTTAEGVETEAQLASLTAEGCTEFQGYLFSKPQPAASIMRMIAGQTRHAVAI